jgi:hypothetical protein
VREKHSVHVLSHTDVLSQLTTHMYPHTLRHADMMTLSAKHVDVHTHVSTLTHTHIHTHARVHRYSRPCEGSKALLSCACAGRVLQLGWPKGHADVPSRCVCVCLCVRECMC